MRSGSSTRLEESLGAAPLEELRGRRPVVALGGLREELQERLEERFEDSPFHSDRVRALLARRSFQDRRLLRAFPKLSSVTYREALEKLREQMDREAT